MELLNASQAGWFVDGAMAVVRAALDYATALDRFARQQVPSVRSAHDVLARWHFRHMTAPGADDPTLNGFDQSWADITDQSWDWRCYVANRVPGAIAEVAESSGAASSASGCGSWRRWTAT